MKMKVHDRVKILDQKEVPYYLHNQTGIIISPGKLDRPVDYWPVKLDNGGSIFFFERNLKLLDDLP